MIDKRGRTLIKRDKEIMVIAVAWDGFPNPYFTGKVIKGNEKYEEGLCYDFKCNQFRYIKEDEMEKETVLEIEWEEVFDKYGVRIAYQNEEVLKRGGFEDEEIGVISGVSPCVISGELYIRGCFKEYDDNIILVSKDQLDIIIDKVNRINEKYGIKKRWRAERGEEYWYFCGDMGITHGPEEYINFDNERYFVGNYFKTKEEAKEYVDKIKEMLLNR